MLARRFASAIPHQLIGLPLPALRLGMRSILVTLDKLEPSYRLVEEARTPTKYWKFLNFLSAKRHQNE
jgi:hypothetical protein